MSLTSVDAGKELDNDVFKMERYSHLLFHEGCGGEIDHWTEHYNNHYYCLKCHRSWVEYFDDDEYNYVEDKTPTCQYCGEPFPNSKITINGIPYRIDLGQFDARKYLCEDCKKLFVRH